MEQLGLPLAVAASVAIPVALAMVLGRWLAPNYHSQTAHPNLVQMTRHKSRIFLISLLAALASTAVLMLVIHRGLLAYPHPGLGRYFSIAPFAVAMTGCLARYASERFWPPVSGEIRVAPLARRTVWATGGPLLKLCLAIAGILVATTIYAGYVGDATGRLLPISSEPYPSWPGWYYGVPIIVGTALTLSAMFLVLHTINRQTYSVDQPPGLSDTGPNGRRLDQVFRGTSSTQILTLILVVFGIVLGNMLRIIGMALAQSGVEYVNGQLATLNPELITIGTLLEYFGPALVIFIGIASIVNLVRGGTLFGSRRTLRAQTVQKLVTQ